MDEIDTKILQIIQKDVKVPYHKIGEQLRIGASTVHYRVQRMIENGIIEHCAAIVDPEKIGFKVIAWIGLAVDPLKMSGIANILSTYNKVQIVGTASGSHDILIQVIARDERKLWNFINKKIKTIEGVQRDIDVSIFLDIFKRTHMIALGS